MPATVEVVITDRGQLAILGARLKVAGAVGLRRELLKGIREAAKPLIEDARAAALEELPKAGGLNERIASDPMSVRTRLTGSNVGVRIVTTTTDTRGADRGRLRHPTFGHRDRWVTQAIRPGWFTDTLSREAPKVTPAIIAAMEVVAEALTVPV